MNANTAIISRVSARSGGRIQEVRGRGVRCEAPSDGSTPGNKRTQRITDALKGIAKREREYVEQQVRRVARQHSRTQQSIKRIIDELKEEWKAADEDTAYPDFQGPEEDEPWARDGDDRGRPM